MRCSKCNENLRGHLVDDGGYPYCEENTGGKA